MNNTQVNWLLAITFIVLTLISLYVNLIWLPASNERIWKQCNSQYQK
jgi:hypothetical protein